MDPTKQAVAELSIPPLSGKKYPVYTNEYTVQNMTKI